MEACTSYKPCTTRNRKDLSQVRFRQVPALLLLLHRQNVRPMLSARSHLGAVPAPVLYERPQLAGEQLTKRKISCVLRDNAFLSITICQGSGTFRSIKVSDLHRALDGFARILPDLPRVRLTYHWSTMQVEYATDIVFRTIRASRLVRSDRANRYSLRETGEYRNLPGSQASRNYQGEMGNNFTPHSGHGSSTIWALPPSRCMTSSISSDRDYDQRRLGVQALSESSRVGDPVHKPHP